MKESPENLLSPFRLRLHEIIFEADTRAGKLFDLVLIFLISASAVLVMLDSVKEVREAYGSWLLFFDWFFTVFFTVEYGLRLYSVVNPLKYAASFYGIIDLLAVLPGYLEFFLPGTRYLAVIRVFRVLRVFRILKLAHYLKESEDLIAALLASRKRITVFVMAVFTLVIFIGSIMYVIEGEDNGFTSIPVSIYWAVVTLTTVGYGDISPKTPLGQAFSVLIMILGYGIIAIPTGIVTAEITGLGRAVSAQSCPFCSREGHDTDAVCCKYCGNRLN